MVVGLVESSCLVGDGGAAAADWLRPSRGTPLRSGHIDPWRRPRPLHPDCVDPTRRPRSTPAASARGVGLAPPWRGGPALDLREREPEGREKGRGGGSGEGERAAGRRVRVRVGGRVGWVVGGGV